jgi:hypothetical protein
VYGHSTTAGNQEFPYPLHLFSPQFVFRWNIVEIGFMLAAMLEALVTFVSRQFVLVFHTVFCHIWELLSINI